MDKKTVIKAVIYSLVTVGLAAFALNTGKTYGCKVSLLYLIQKNDPGMFVYLDGAGLLSELATAHCNEALGK